MCLFSALIYPFTIASWQRTSHHPLPSIPSRTAVTPSRDRVPLLACKPIHLSVAGGWLRLNDFLLLSLFEARRQVMFLKVSVNRRGSPGPIAPGNFQGAPLVCSSGHFWESTPSHVTGPVQSLVSSPAGWGEDIPCEDILLARTGVPLSRIASCGHTGGLSCFFMKLINPSSRLD